MDRGLIRALGVSNFDAHELRRLLMDLDPPDRQGAGASLRHRPTGTVGLGLGLGLGTVATATTTT